MIERGEYEYLGVKYDSRLSCSDFRFSMAAVGMLKFLGDASRDVGIAEKRIGTEDGVEYFFYNQAEVTGGAAREKYLRFVEKYFAKAMHHPVVEELLAEDSLSDEQIKLLHEQFNKKAVMKNIFGREKYSPENREHLKQLLEENRYEIIEKTYIHGKSTYSNFCNKSKDTRIFKKKGQVCRILGYYVDWTRKSNSVGFFQNHNVVNAEDAVEFDYIPFACTTSRESIFVNNNYSLAECFKLNDVLETEFKRSEAEKQRSSILWMLRIIREYFEYNVEIITKKRGQDFFQTVYLRKEAIEVLQQLEADGYKYIFDVLTNACICAKYYLSVDKTWCSKICPSRHKCKKEYVLVERIVAEHILNYVHLDDFINKLLKGLLKNDGHGYLIKALLKINILLKRGGSDMNKKMKATYAAARAVAGKLEENKLKSYRQKLLSSIIANDDDRFKQILIQLSLYSEVDFSFALDLFDDFEANKDIAYTFIVELKKDRNDKNDKNDRKDNQAEA